MPQAWSPWLMGCALAALVTLAGCASPPPAPPWLHLPTLAAGGQNAGSTAGMPPAAAATPWRLQRPVTLPAALEREAVLVAVAPGQWVAWQGLRWSEPLRDALPRVLAADLAELRQAPVWDGPTPPVPTLRVQIDDWEASLPLAQVQLRARWTLLAPGASGPIAPVAPGAPGAPVVPIGPIAPTAATPGLANLPNVPSVPSVTSISSGTVLIRQPWPQATPAGLVQAQRAALRALAEQLLQQAGAAPQS
ncbi:PqiC family protein [Aquabacterium sp. OR-4]|uniref:PqiC family protein n=1 Tax=Aquabacterium sp. OR-4 TaxID=2978127 RepID=UPI0028C768A8|nr:ABC-type transport auxiliary lipoprotein family protein [Aquabacterium sp. OR-4]MDT7835069.1 ABC-type transport auxiliary lipoprotein family protein [Aquabacterium sp. OR-4]